MFIAIQFPFADIRGFVDSQTNRLNHPTWPVPKPDEEFIRISGMVRHRRRGGLDSWPGEEVYCGAKRALRFKPLLSRQPIGSLGKSVSLLCIFRRFLSNGEAVSRMEIGLRIRTGRLGERCFPLDGRGCFDVIQASLSIPVRVPLAEGSPDYCQLLDSQQYLAKHYLQSTTRRVGGNLSSTEDWWLSPGTPLLLIEYRPNEISELPKYTQSVRPHLDFCGTLDYCRIEWASKRLGVWFLQLDQTDFDLVRRLRMHLFRLHAERECLKQVLRLIKDGRLAPQPYTPFSDRLQLYLQNSVSLLSHKEYYGLSQSKILEEVQKLEDLVTPGERITLLSQLSSINIRKNIYHNVEKLTSPGDDSARIVYVIHGNASISMVEGEKTGGITMSKYEINIGGNVKVSGDLVVAETIQNSFNKVSSSDAPLELKKKLKELSEAVADMCEHLSQDKARVAVRDLETLTNEAVSKQPRREWLHLSAKSLIEAAETVGKIAVPVIGIVNAVLTLLG